MELVACCILLICTEEPIDEHTILATLALACRSELSGHCPVSLLQQRCLSVPPKTRVFLTSGIWRMPTQIVYNMAEHRDFDKKPARDVMEHDNPLRCGFSD